MRRNWELNRRHFLRGVGACCALPYLDVMAESSKAHIKAKRMCAIFWPYGACLPPEDHKNYEKWNWYPHKTGPNYTFKEGIQPLEPFRSDISIFSGLSHPGARALAHQSGDVYLTGANVFGNPNNNHQSMDQLAAETLGRHTRLDYLSLGTEGGVGRRGSIYTLSWDRSGNPIPCMNNPREIFEYLFAGGPKKERLKRLQSEKKVVDVILDDYRAVNRRLGRADQQKMQQYLDALNEIEIKLKKTEQWLDIPPPKVDKSSFNLDYDKADPEGYFRVMFDLMHITFETDLSRVIAFQMGSEHVQSKYTGLISKATGCNHHKSTHQRKYENLIKIDHFLSSQFAHFLGKMKDSNLLDSSAILYGCGQSTVHEATNGPTIIAGGKDLGFKHGSFQSISDKIPLSNALYSMLDAVDVKVDSFSDSTGKLDALYGRA